MSATAHATAHDWDRLREGYLQGAAATELCARFGVSRSQLYARAKAEAWPRADVADVLDDAAPFDPDAPPPCPQALAEQALRRLAHAVAQGRLREALGWMRLHRELRRLAAEEAGEMAGAPAG